MIRTAACALCVLLLPVSTHSVSAQSECRPGVAETVKLFETWRTYMQDRLGVDEHAAVQDLKTEADRLGRAMEGVEGLNHFNARYRQVFEDMVDEHRPQASMDLSERLAYQVGWAATSLKSLSGCLEVAGVDTSNVGDTSIAAAATLMRYVRPNMFASIGILEQALRSDDPVDFEEARAIWRSLQAVNSFVEVSQGSFSECENTIRTAVVRGTTFVIPRRYFTNAEEPAIVRLDTEAAAMTLGEAKFACDLS